MGLSMTARSAEVVRNTKETKIRAAVNLDGTGQGDLRTGMAFLDHMLDQVVRHGLIDITLVCEGDHHIDDHHSAEDRGITLGQAFAQAGGEVWLQCGHRHPTVFAGIHAVARMGSTHRALGGGHAQLPGQGQPGCSL